MSSQKLQTQKEITALNNLSLTKKLIKAYEKLSNQENHILDITQICLGQGDLIAKNNAAHIKTETEITKRVTSLERDFLVLRARVSLVEKTKLDAKNGF